MMRWMIVHGVLIIGSLAVAQLVSPLTAAEPPPEKVSAEVLYAASIGGPVRVNVTLAAPAAPPPPISRPDIRGRVAAAQAAVLARLTPADFVVIHRHSAVPGLTGLASPAGIAKLASDPDVAAVTLDGVGSGGSERLPIDAAAPALTLSRSVPMIHADAAHALGVTGVGVTVAVLDSGADTDHPDLADSISSQECFLTGAGSRCPNGLTRQSGVGAAEDDLGHGSNVTGIVTSNGVVSSVGVAPGAKVLLYKILNSSNQGQFSDWDAALNDIIANHPEVRVVNMSLVSFSTYPGVCNSVDPTTTAAFNTLTAAGVVIFVSAGNNAAKAAITYPACVSNAVSVGAVYDQTFSSSTFFGCTNTPATIDVPTCWSNSSPGLELLAPGSFIVSDGLSGGTSTYTGTSQASPHAAGVAALMLQNTPSVTPANIRARLKSSGVPRTDPANLITTPRIDALAAITAATLGGIDNEPGADPSGSRTDLGGGGKAPWLPPAGIVVAAISVFGMRGALSALKRRRDRA